MQRTITPRRLTRRCQAGVTLIELLVGLTIGLLLIIIASAIYLYSKQSYSAATETSQMEENGRFALDLMGKYIQSAGFAMVDPDAPGPALPLDGKLSGCVYGYVNASAPTSLADLACRTATPAGQRTSASISTRFETDVYATGSNRKGFDCTNEAAASKVLGTGIRSYEARSYFFISTVSVQTPGGTTPMGQLSCVSDATPEAAGVAGTATFHVQPLVPGIEQLAFKYIAKSGQFVALPTTEAAWQNIAAIELCVLARSIQSSGKDANTASYQDCNDVDIPAEAKESYRRLKQIVALRNTASL